jgi:hypothetical protein
MGGGRISLKISALFPLLKTFRMRPFLSKSISMDSTLKQSVTLLRVPPLPFPPERSPILYNSKLSVGRHALHRHYRQAAGVRRVGGGGGGVG